jgi:hypothetical protein
MPLACIYGHNGAMKVVTFAEREELADGVEWFRHPNDVKVNMEKKHEEPIRRVPRKRRLDGKNAPNET